MSLSVNYPVMRPTLNLNFARARQLDPRITFTRASTATYFDSSGVLQTAIAGQPRFDFSPTTLQSLGLLIEEQRTNSLLQSGWDGAVAGSPGTAPTSWSISSVGSPSLEVANAQYGTAIPALALTFNCVATERHWLSQTINVTSGVQYAISVWVEAVTGNAGAVITITNGTGTATINQTVNSPSTPGRYTLLFTATGTGTINVRCGAGTTSGVPSSVSIRLSRIQLEAGSFATSYIPTTAAAATRNTDVATMTGTNFSSWYRADEGTLYAEGSAATSTDRFPVLAFISDGGTQNFLLLGYLTNVIGSLEVKVSNVVQAVIFPFVSTFNRKAACAYKTDDFVVTYNGASPNTDTSGGVPVVDRLTIGNTFSTISATNGHIRRIAYYPVRLSNDQLQALTR